MILSVSMSLPGTNTARADTFSIFLKAILFIEDSYDTCKELSENGIKSILMTTKMNQDIHQGNNIVRVKNWKEIYKEILRIESKI